MTREKAIENFRAMWHWMADKSEKSKRKVAKIEYFMAHNFDILEIPLHCCFLCEYAEEQFLRRDGNDKCEYCPIDFGYDFCTAGAGVDETIYDLWCDCLKKEWEEAARLCREIAELPEKEDT